MVVDDSDDPTPFHPDIDRPTIEGHTRHWRPWLWQPWTQVQPATITSCVEHTCEWRCGNDLSWVVTTESHIGEGTHGVRLSGMDDVPRVPSAKGPGPRESVGCGHESGQFRVVLEAMP